MIDSITRVELAKNAEIPVGVGHVIQVDQTEISLIKLATGDIYALENKSPHPKGGTLAEGLISGKYIYCPVYDWKISLETGDVQAPDHGKVKTYSVLLENNCVYLVGKTN
jgi:nitrite reductase (NADH) small subunit